jgi:hypothetical protein
MADWWSVEVFHGGAAAWTWWMARREALIEAAITNGARDWSSLFQPPHPPPPYPQFHMPRQPMW